VSTACRLRSVASPGRSAFLRGCPGPGTGTGTGTERGPRPEIEVAVLLDLLGAACSAGASIPGALAVVGAAAGGARGPTLTRVAAALALGGSWAEAWSGAEPALEPVASALQPSWQDGVAPAGSLRAVAATLRRERRTRALEAAGRLGVRLVLPLGLCHLPAFVLVGLVPVLVSMASSLG